jgi:predicted metallopeptidase
MKKLAQLILLSVCVSYASTAQTIIRIHGDADALAVRGQVKQSLEYLNIREKLCIDVHFTEFIPKNLKGLTLAVPSPDPANNKTQFYRIRIDARLDDVQRHDVLAHEMMHVRQYQSGDLKVIGGKVLWKGKNYSFTHTDPRKTPWELEAYRYDQYLAKAMEKIHLGMPPLIASEIKD